MQLFTGAALAAAFISVAACGNSQEEFSATKAVLPDLRFAGNTIVAHLSIGATVPINHQQQLVLPCAAQYFRAQYKYGNFGTAGAGNHVNKSFGGGSYGFAQLPLGIGATRSAWGSFGPLAANAWTQIAIRLDDGAAVTESNEFNNVWSAWVKRQCP